MMKNYMSLVPGPTQVDERILKSMSTQIVTHMNENWRGYYLDTCEKLKKILMTTGDCYLINCSVYWWHGKRGDQYCGTG